MLHSTSPLPPRHFQDERMRRLSIQGAPVRPHTALSGKGKQQATDSPSSSFADISPFPTSYHDTSGGSVKKNRGSILLAASDALSFTFGRKRKPSRVTQPAAVAHLPEVIEISAPRRDDELEERERLRDAAAASIGLGPAMLESRIEREESILEEHEAMKEEDEDYDDDDDVQSIETAPPRVGGPRSTLQPLATRNRAGSLATTLSQSYAIQTHPSSSLSHTRTLSATPVAVPPFPSSPSALTSVSVISSLLPKYYPPPSLRIFALSNRQWKMRYMVLSSPTPGVTRSLPWSHTNSNASSVSSKQSNPSPSYLHLFKTSGGDEKEIERLEINEDSVVFVSEEEVGGRGQVIKVGGVKLSSVPNAAPKPLTGVSGSVSRREGGHRQEESTGSLRDEDGGRTTWMFQIVDPVEVRMWISGIKSAILGQRSMRAGLGNPGHSNGIEPRGDMDVMLSMRAHTSWQGTQSITFSPTPSPIHSTFSEYGTHETSHSRVDYPPVRPDLITSRSDYASTKRSRSPPLVFSPDPASSSLSIRSVSSMTKSIPTSPKILHATLPVGPQTNPPPASPRVTLKGLFTTRPRSPSCASIASTQDQDHREAAEDSFGSMGNNLLSMMRSNSEVGASGLSLSPSLSTGDLPILDRKINPERDIVEWPKPRESLQKVPPSSHVEHKDRASKTVFVGGLSLNPPPRKRWTTSYVPPGASTPRAESITSHTSAVDGEGQLYTHTYANGSSAGSFGVQHENGGTPRAASPALTGHSSSFGSPTRARAPSIQSVSTFASAEAGLTVDLSTTPLAKSNSKRWSRQSSSLPKRLTPPVGPPPSVPLLSSNSSVISNGNTRSSITPMPERPSSRASSNRSGTSDMSFISHLPTFFKRASGSSVGTGNSAPSRPVSTHRYSLPPPPLPPPNFAPPATPDHDFGPPLDNPHASRSSFRESGSHRSFRLSTIGPRPLPPPSTALPSRPDKGLEEHHRRTGSGSNTPVASHHSIHPPPTGPLPPTPSSGSVSRHSSIKQRLRILSAPSSPAPNGSLPEVWPVPTESSPRLSFEEPAIFQNDPSFLNMYSPISPMAPQQRPPSPETYPEITSLSPPPRRTSRQLSIFVEREDAGGDPSPPVVPPENTGGNKLLSRGSVISLGVVDVP